jgi:uncharacterized caspase-like protein
MTLDPFQVARLPIRRRIKRGCRVQAARALAILLLWGFTVLHAEAGKRKALVIGNNEYTGFPKLDQAPIKDANAVQQALIAVGFDKSDITVDYDLNYKNFMTALLDFKDRLNPDDSALFYFSGHGFSIDGSDFLAPVNFAIENSKEATRQHSIALTQIINYLSITKNRVVILDACRTDIPLLKQSVKDSSKASLDALVGIQGTGTLVAYAASAGQASSGRSPSGLSFYTQYLVRSLGAHPKDIKTALNDAKEQTNSASGGTQSPAIYDEMQGSFSLTGGIDIQAAGDKPTPSGDISELIQNVSLDDASAFDKLILIREKQPPDQQARIDKAIADRKQYARESLNSGLEGGICGFDPPAFGQQLKQSDRKIRKQAIASCDNLITTGMGNRIPPSQEQMLQLAPKIDFEAPEVVNAALHDSSLLVRAQAVNTVNIWFQGAPGVPPDGFDLLDTRALNEWWKQNEPNRKDLLLLSRAKVYSSRGFSSVTIYDEIQSRLPHAADSFREAFNNTLAQMRSDASRSSGDIRADFGKQAGCASVTKDAEEALPRWGPDDLEHQSGEGDLEFLATCPTDLTFLPRVAEYAAKTRVLIARFWAVTIINKWAGTNLDAFNTIAIQDWWEKHRAQYQTQKASPPPLIQRHLKASPSMNQSNSGGTSSQQQTTGAASAYSRLFKLPVNIDALGRPAAVAPNGDRSIGAAPRSFARAVSYRV